MLGIAKGKSIFVYSETKLYRLENAHDNTITSNLIYCIHFFLTSNSRSYMDGII